MKIPLLLTCLGMLLTTEAIAQSNVFPASGNVGIGTTTPNSALEINGDTRINGILRIGDHYVTAPQTIHLDVGAEKWIKIATIPNNHYVRFIFRNGSANSEEVAEVKVIGTYFNQLTGISVDRQTYNEHLREVRAVGLDGGVRHIFVRVRASEYPAAISWQAVDSRGQVVVHNTEETPGNGLSHQISGNQIHSTNFHFVTTGNLGIGTINPAYRLSVSGVHAAGATEQLLAGFTHAPNQSGIYLGYRMEAGAVSSALIRSDNGLPITLGTSMSNTAMTIANDGNVGIGVTAPAHKLTVNGTIRAREVTVESTGWPDYVFSDSYKLMPLLEIERHILKHRHLPGVPSANDINQTGISLGEIPVMLLKKIEELTLHQIAQEKRIIALEMENRNLRLENR